MRNVKLHVNLTQRARNQDLRFYVEFTFDCYVNGTYTHWHNDFKTPPYSLGDPDKCKNDEYWFFKNHFNKTYPGCEATQDQYRLCIDIWQYRKNPKFDPELWRKNPFHPDPFHPNMEWFMDYQGHHKFNNPITGRPYMTYSGDGGDTFTFSEGERWTSTMKNGTPISVLRADDSDDYKEFWIDLG
jgi:hypothetical protein